MKGRIITGLVLCCLVANAQDPKEIILKTQAKCRSINSGYYEMTELWKSITKQDTLERSFKCHFKKLKDDTLYSLAFHFKGFLKDTCFREIMYTGNEFVRLILKDSSAIIMSKSKWAKEIKSDMHNSTLYSPITSTSNSPIQRNTDIGNSKKTFQLLGTEAINGEVCYHIRVNDLSENDSTESMQFLREEYDYWISINNLVPIQYSIAMDMIMDNDTMHQFERVRLNKYDFGNFKGDTLLTLDAIPPFFKTKDFATRNRLKLIPRDSLAPNWNLVSLTNKKVSLSDLKGKIVLIDFFYKSCYPCLVALPALQELHAKYADRGLAVVGIDPYDKRDPDLITFLNKKGVNYEVLLEGKSCSEDYRISAYPTMYLIGRDGRILFVQEGYGKENKDALEKLIIEFL